MGRRKLFGEEMMSVRLGFQTTEEQRKRISDAAHDARQSLSEFMRELVDEAFSRRKTKKA